MNGMEDYEEDDGDFNGQQLYNLMQRCIEQVLNIKTADGKGDDKSKKELQAPLIYNREKVNQWSTQMLDMVTKELAKLNKDFKYAVTCIIQQANGAGL